MACKNKRRSTTVLEEILLDLHPLIARLSWLIQEYLFLVKKVIKTNTENSDLAGQLFKLLYQNFTYIKTLIYICMYIYFLS